MSGVRYEDEVWKNIMEGRSGVQFGSRKAWLEDQSPGFGDQQWAMDALWNMKENEEPEDVLEAAYEKEKRSEKALESLEELNWLDDSKNGGGRRKKKKSKRKKHSKKKKHGKRRKSSKRRKSKKRSKCR